MTVLYIFIFFKFKKYIDKLLSSFLYFLNFEILFDIFSLGLWFLIEELLPIPSLEGKGSIYKLLINNQPSTCCFAYINRKEKWLLESWCLEEDYFIVNYIVIGHRNIKKFFQCAGTQWISISQILCPNIG